MSDLLVQTLGWVGSALLVVSLLQRRMRPLRFLNLIASLALVAFNALVATWPMAALNFVVAIIDAYYLLRPDTIVTNAVPARISSTSKEETV